MPSRDDPPAPHPDARPRPGRLTRLRTGVRRAVLARRRLLAAVLAAVAVAAGLRATTAPPPATVPVSVAATDLAGGSTIGPDDLRTVGFAPGTAPEALAADPVGRVLAGPVAAGEPVTEVRLVGGGLGAGSGLTAVPVRLPDPGMVALLRVGDRVDLVSADPQGGSPAVVVSDVPVLAVPPAEESSSGGLGLTGRLVVVGVPDAEVAEVADAAVRTFVTFAWTPAS